jgi:hypothetical protein
MFQLSKRAAVAAVSVMLAGLLSWSCAKTNTASSEQPHATVTLRDGTTIGGTVTSSSPSEITLATDDKTTRTIPMSQVRSIDYDEPAPTTPEAANAPPSPGGTASPARARSSAPPRVVREEHTHPTEAAISSRTLTVPAGAEVSVRTEETIDSGKAVEGQTYAAEVTRDVLDESGDVVIPRGSNAQIVIRSASKGGRFKGTSDLVLDLASVSVNGRRYALSTVDLVKKGKDGVGANRRTGEFTGGGAAIGAIIGAIAGGGKGAAIGAASGAGAGAATQILTKGGSIKIPVETVLTFRLDQPLRVVQQ